MHHLSQSHLAEMIELDELQLQIVDVTQDETISPLDCHGYFTACSRLSRGIALHLMKVILHLVI